MKDKASGKENKVTTNMFILQKAISGTKQQRKKYLKFEFQVRL